MQAGLVSAEAAGRLPAQGRSLTRSEGHRVPGLGWGPVKGRRGVMRTLGYVTSITIAVGAAAIGLLAIKSLPDVRRYLRMRKM